MMHGKYGIMENNGSILYMMQILSLSTQHYIKLVINNILLDYIKLIQFLFLSQQYKKIIYKRYLYQCNRVCIRILLPLVIVVFQQNI